MILFVLVIALVLLSYFVERSRDSDALALFRSEHLSRLSQIEQKLEEQSAAIDTLEEKYTALHDELVKLRADMDASEFMGGRTLSEQAEEMEALRQEFDALQSEMDKLLEEIGNNKE